MLKIPVFALLTASCLSGLFSCNPSPTRVPEPDSTATSVAGTNANDLDYDDQRQIEKVVLGFCENFDKGDLQKCVEFMDDSIRGHIDGVKLKGKQHWTTKIDSLLASIKNTHYQTRHMITNMQFFPEANDTVKVSMYASWIWTDLLSGEIQLMSVGYYKGKLVKKKGNWLIAVLNSLPDSRLVKQYFYKDIEADRKDTIN
ncbi:nuclear transport factor 2 family protein [Chitinophaga sp. 212800010-3]|uniref:nuclear transport factor 2 family protein n=1 Tax=unclassified Chitinophaga TaxID=2619133 RepID=UPI002E0ED768